MQDEGRIIHLETEIKRLKKKIEEQDDEQAIKDRQDHYRFSRVDFKLFDQEIHKNLKGLNADDHTQYLTNARHDVSARHGDTVLGDRTIDDSKNPTGSTGKIGDLLSWLGYMVKKVTGENSWKDAPGLSLDDLNTHIDAANPHSGSEPSFNKNTAFNKNFGSGEGTVCQGNDSRLSNARDPSEHGNEAHSEAFITAVDIPTGETEDIEVITEVDFVNETVTKAMLHFENGLYVGMD